MRRLWANAAVLAAIARGLLLPRPRPTTTEQRLAMLPPSLPAGAPVTIHWDAHQIPFIEAQSETDLAAGLGLVHAHLRLGQIELMRRFALGRVAELIGPRGIDIDRTIRLFGFARAVPGIIAALPEPTRRWCEAFVAGFNHFATHLARERRLPHEFAVLGIRPERWTLADLFTLARLMSADVNWMVWARLLHARAAASAEEWREFWPLLLAGGGTEAWTEGGALPADQAAAENILRHSTRGNSNCAAVAACRSASGAAMIASDPHLPITVPSLWLIAGLHAPGLQAVGLMLPGIPFVALGRNPWIAWGGTSLHAASSELFDASGEKLTERWETILVRGLGSRRIRLRESRLGPIVSDGAMFRSERPMALRWIGHAPSDELGAFLGIMRARDWAEFRAALGGFAIPGQNMLYAGTDGRVGQVLAAHLPRRDPSAAPELIAGPARAAEWEDIVTSKELPAEIDPASGFIASANQYPGATPVPVGFFFSPRDRVERMRSLLAGAERITAADLERLQTDVCHPGALRLRDFLLRNVPDRARPRAQKRLVAALAGWDGCYPIDSPGAAAFELLFGCLARRLWPGDRIAPMQAVWTTRELLARKIAALPEAALQQALEQALADSARKLRRWRSWGALHRLRLRHGLGEAPGLGRRYGFGEFASPGGNDTLHKTGFALCCERHAVSYGAGARHISDLADPDDNRFVLLGGQDGWFGSANFLDQVGLWRAGGYITVPLQLETAWAKFPHKTVLHPVGGSG